MDRKFVWVGNHPAIDFVNTKIVRNQAVQELLQEPRDLLQWCAGAGLIPPRQIGGVVRRLGPAGLRKSLRIALAFRKLLRSAFDAATRGRSFPKQALWQANRLLGVPATGWEIVREGRRFRMVHRWKFVEPEDLCRPMADAVADLLANRNLARLRRCKNPRCILFFYDTARSGTRTWCSVRLCGNKLRVAAFRRRQRRAR